MPIQAYGFFACMEQVYGPVLPTQAGLLSYCDRCHWNPGTAIWSSSEASTDHCRKLKLNTPGQRHLRASKRSLPAFLLLGSPGFQYWMVPHYTEFTKRWFGLEKHADMSAQWQWLQTCLHSKASTPPAVHNECSKDSAAFITPDILAVIIVPHLQGNITLFLGLLHILGIRLRWSYVLFFFLSVFLLKQGQVFVSAEVCRFSLLLMCSLLCADGQENSGLLPRLPPETDVKSSK